MKYVAILFMLFYQILRLNGINLSSLSLLPKLKFLESLYLAHNTLSSLSGLARLFPSLELLDVAWNSLEGPQAVIDIGRLASLCELSVEGNPLCEDAPR